jgi:hypothetical protein
MRGSTLRRSTDALAHDTTAVVMTRAISSTVWFVLRARL